MAKKKKIKIIQCIEGKVEVIETDEELTPIDKL